MGALVVCALSESQCQFLNANFQGGTNMPAKTHSIKHACHGARRAPRRRGNRRSFDAGAL